MRIPHPIAKLTGSFRNLPIRYKLLSGFFLAALTFTAFAIYLLVVFHGLQRSFSFLNTESDKRAQFVQLGDYTNEHGEAVKSYILTRGVKWERQYDETSGELDSLVAKLRPTISDPREVKDFNAFIDASSRLRGTELLIMAKTKDNDVQRAIELFDNNYESQQQEVEQTVQDMVAIENSKFGTQQTHNDATLASVREVLVITLAAVIIFTVVIALSIASFIARGINKLVESVRQIASGHLGARVEVVSTDEMGELGLSINNMAGKLEDFYSTLEQKVRDKTAELAQKVIEAQSLKARAETAQAKDEAILANIGEGLLVTDASGKILLANSAIEHVLGVMPADCIGKLLSALAHFTDGSGDDITSDTDPIGQTLKDGKSKDTVLFYERQAGAKATVNITVTPISPAAGQTTASGAIAIIRDITKEREIDRMKTEFISLASHQLRTPLSAIKWFAELLSDPAVGALSDEQREYVKNITGSTERMIDLVGALLNISRIESGRIIIEPQPTDPKELVEGITQELQIKVKDREQTLTVDVQPDLPKVSVDPNLIRQVYLNLLTNAIKYTPKHGKITVTVRQEGNELISSITDNGYGIPKEQQSRVFEKFFRADNVQGIVTDGTGLGLYLIKAIVESSKGRIWFESVEGEGTTFHFALPMSGMAAKKGEVSLQ